MRRRPYAELLAFAAGKKAEAEAAPSPSRSSVASPARVSALSPPRTSAPAPAAASLLKTVESLPPDHAPMPVSQKAEMRCRAELKGLTSMVEDSIRRADANHRKECLFVSEKLAAASSALDRGDGDGAWVHLFGAATLCRTFSIHPEKAARVLERLNGMFE